MGNKLEILIKKAQNSSVTLHKIFFLHRFLPFCIIDGIEWNESAR